MSRATATVVTFLILVSFPCHSEEKSPSQTPKQAIGGPPNQETKNTENKPEAAQRGTEQSPFIIKILPAEQTQEEAATNATDRPEQRSNGWFSGWNLGDKIAAIASTAAIFQVAALLATFCIMKSAGRRQLRAYVHIVIDHEQMVHIPGTDNKPSVATVLKNSGQTPAHDVVAYHQFYVGCPTIYGPLPPIKTEGTGSQIVIHPGTEWPGIAQMQCPLTDQETKAIMANEKRLYFYGEIVYRDAFHRSRSTHYRLMTHDYGGGRRGFLWCQDGNKAT